MDNFLSIVYYDTMVRQLISGKFAWIPFLHMFRDFIFTTIIHNLAACGRLMLLIAIYFRRALELELIYDN